MKKILILAVCVTLAGCLPMSDERAIRAVESAGITNVRIEGIPYLGCGDGDAFRSKWTGTNAQGKSVSGVVCGGWFKGATVRYD